MFIGTEAACALIMHTAKIGAYGASNLMSANVLLLGAALIRKDATASRQLTPPTSARIGPSTEAIMTSI